MTSVARKLTTVADTTTEDDPVPTTIETDERAVIGAAILAGADVRAVMLGSYRPADLTDPRCRFVDGILRRMQAENLPVDVLTVQQYAAHHGLLEGAPRVALAGWLADVTAESPTPVFGPHYAVAVVETASRRAVREAGEQMIRVADTASWTDLERVCRAASEAARSAVLRAKQVTA